MAGPGLEAGFQHMHAQAVDALNEARANAGGRGMSGRVGVFMCALSVIAGFPGRTLCSELRDVMPGTSPA